MKQYEIKLDGMHTATEMQELCICTRVHVCSVVRDCLINSYNLKIQVSMLLTSISMGTP
jgi:hypothetical protein